MDDLLAPPSEFKHDNLADLIFDLRSTVFEHRTQAAEYFHLDHTTISRYEKISDEGKITRPQLGYLACLAMLVLELRQKQNALKPAMPVELLRDVNRAVRNYYPHEIAFKDFDTLVRFAQKYKAERDQEFARKEKGKKQEEAPGKPERSPVPVIIERPVQIEIPAYPGPKPGSAPHAPALVVGRGNDIDNLKKLLGVGVQERSGAIIQVLTAIKGWPGVGKTTLASAIAYDEEIIRAFPDGVLWVSLGQEPNVFSELAGWGRALGIDEVLRARKVEEAQALLSAALRTRRFLLIIDDVWRPQDAAPFNVGGRQCATLITTRRNDVAIAVAPAAKNIYQVKVLNDEDALDLLKWLAPQVVEQYPEECLVLARELEGLPLALQVAGHLLNTEYQNGLGVSQFIEELKAGAKVLTAKAPADRLELVNETTPTIAALLQKSLNMLDEPTQDCFAYLGAFAPKPATFDLDALKYVWRVEDPAPTVRLLVGHGLLEYRPNMGRYQMHALLVMLAKTLLTDD